MNKQGVHDLSGKKENTRKYRNNINGRTIQRNSFNGRKKYIKVSSITDSYGTPLASVIIPGTESDMKTIKKTIDKISVNLHTKRNSRHNRYKQYFLADSGYCSKANKKLVSDLGYTPLLKYNKGNTKNKKK